MEFPPDIGFVIQIVTFLALWWILKRWMFDPSLRVLELRRERTAGQLEEAARINEQTEQLRADYTRKIEAARAAARQQGDAIRADAEREEERILTAAREESSTVIEKARAEIAHEVEDARASMLRDAAEISVEAAAKILGRPVQ